MKSSRLKLFTAALLALAAIAVLVLQRRTVNRLSAENADLRKQTAQVSARSEALLQAATQSATNRSDRSAETSSELLRLRGEVSRRHQLPETPPSTRGESTQPPTPEQLREQAKVWNDRIEDRMNRPSFGDSMLQDAAGKVDGHYLGSAEAVAERMRALEKLPASELEHLRKEAHVTLLDKYELLFRGSFRDIANPGTAIVFRERRARQIPGGSWLRRYTFADGRSLLGASENGDFSVTEAKYAVQLVPEKATGTGEPGAQ